MIEKGGSAGMIKIAVCDDEAAMCEQIGQMTAQVLGQWREPFEMIHYLDPRDLLEDPSYLDLLFLDIQMPGLNGVELARRLRAQGSDCAIIFVTVLEDHMLDAFEVEAVDYLCKPVDPERLKRTLKRVLKRWKDNAEKSLFIQTKTWSRNVKVRDIYYCEVINRKIYLHTKSGVIEYYGRLKETEKQLGSSFIKCHRSYLVNLYHLREYNDGMITLENGARIPVSRNQQQALMEGMMQYMR